MDTDMIMIDLDKAIEGLSQRVLWSTSSVKLIDLPESFQ